MGKEFGIKFDLITLKFQFLSMSFVLKLRGVTNSIKIIGLFYQYIRINLELKLSFLLSLSALFLFVHNCLSYLLKKGLNFLIRIGIYWGYLKILKIGASILKESHFNFVI